MWSKSYFIIPCYHTKHTYCPVSSLYLSDDVKLSLTFSTQTDTKERLMQVDQSKTLMYNEATGEAAFLLVASFAIATASVHEAINQYVTQPRSWLLRWLHLYIQEQSCSCCQGPRGKPPEKHDDKAVDAEVDFRVHTYFPILQGPRGRRPFCLFFIGFYRPSLHLSRAKRWRLKGIERPRHVAFLSPQLRALWPSFALTCKLHCVYLAWLKHLSVGVKFISRGTNFYCQVNGVSIGRILKVLCNK